jgi:hypothetical protein
MPAQRGNDAVDHVEELLVVVKRHVTEDDFAFAFMIPALRR